MITSAEIMAKGMDCLITNLGHIETQQFISTIMREKFDYTKWRQEHLGGMSLDEISSGAVAYAKEHPRQLKSQMVDG